VISSLFDFSIASLALTFFLIIIGIGVSPYLIWVPVLLILMFGLTAGMGMIFSCANLFFMDVKYIVEIILTFAIFFTPVFYEASDFKNWKKFILLNPIAPVLEGFNSAIVLKQNPELAWLGYSTVWSLAGLFIAWNIFYRLEHKFAERI